MGARETKLRAGSHSVSRSAMGTAVAALGFVLSIGWPGRGAARSSLRSATDHAGIHPGGPATPAQSAARSIAAASAGGGGAHTATFAPLVANLAVGTFPNAVGETHAGVRR